jgi:ABC-2 type transport system permease protein
LRKLLTIAWKDLTLVFRDPAALLIMLLTPFALTLVMNFAFGGAGAGISRIPIVIVNSDGEELGTAFEDVFKSESLAELIDPREAADEGSARAMVDREEVAAALIIPEGFTGRVLPSGSGDITTSAEPATIEIYANPTRPVSAGLVRGIAEGVLGRFLAGVAGGQVALGQLVAGGLLAPQEALQRGQEIGERAAQIVTSGQPPITVRGETATGEAQEGFNLIGYLAPSMAILSLLFTTMAGARTILAEREGGTLPRLLSTPTTAAQVLGGKVAGILFTGLAQMGILIAASTLLFNITWGSLLGVAVLIVGLALAATAWGLLVAAFSRTPAQVAQIGAAVALTFAILAGNFLDRRALPDWLRTTGYITPNAWGLEGFSTLAAGGGISDILLPAIALLVMSIILFGIALVLFRRQYS